MRRSPRGENGSPNFLQANALDDSMRFRATTSRSTPGRIRTCNQRIRNPLLYPLSYGRESFHCKDL